MRVQSWPFHRFRTKIAAALMLTAVLSVVLMALIGVRLIRQAEERVAIAELRGRRRPSAAKLPF